MRLSESLKYDLTKLPGGFPIQMLAGFLVTAAQIGFGFVWPSFFTILALVTLPAPFLFLASLIKPKLWLSKPLRYYLIATAAISFLAVMCWVIWLYALGH